MRVYFIGYMGSGKSTLGPKVAEVLEVPFIDLDTEFESRYKISIHDFFAKYGETAFRDIEHNLLNGIAKDGEGLIATGGGTPCFRGNMELMNQTGITVYLKVPIQQLIARLTDSHKKRPVLKTFTSGEFEQELLSHFQFRETFYKHAQLTIDGTNPDTLAIAEQIRECSGLFMPE